MDLVPTPLPLSSAPSSASPSQNPGWSRLLSQLPGTAISLYALHLLDQWFRSLPPGDPLRRQILLGLLVIAAPATVWSGLTLLRQFLNDRSSSKPS
jgi:hypothetical protein